MSEPDVTYVDATIERLQEQLAQLHQRVQQRVLPGSRAPFVKRLATCNTLCEQLLELMRRSGMDRRLGFVNEGKKVQPVMLDRVNDRDAITPEGSGLQDGQH